jgi:hypothetical protein
MNRVWYSAHRGEFAEMARPRKNIDISKFSAAQLRFIVERAVSLGKLAARDIQGFMGEVGGHIRELEERLLALRGEPVSSSGKKGGSTRAGGSAARKRRKLTSPPKRKMKVTPERRRRMQVQGKFLGYSRRLSATKRKAFTAAYKAADSVEAKESVVRKMAASLKA